MYNRLPSAFVGIAAAGVISASQRRIPINGTGSTEGQAPLSNVLYSVRLNIGFFIFCYELRCVMIRFVESPLKRPTTAEAL